jgi:poly(ADP-ribose) glycohydrolase
MGKQINIKVDFANKYIGGGVLSNGCIQEEIMFILSPELIASILFSECLEDNEAIQIKGAERFSCYHGYSESFKWAGDFVDKRNRYNQRLSLYDKI